MENWLVEPGTGGSQQGCWSEDRSDTELVEPGTGGSKQGCWSEDRSDTELVEPGTGGSKQGWSEDRNGTVWYQVERREGRCGNTLEFSCGGTQCPVGQDCISVGGTLRCADPCQNYTALNDDWRSTTNNNQVNGGLHCDQSINFQGWYRLFLGHTSVQMPERCVEINMCGTHAPLWLTEPHPQLSDRVVQRGVCGSWSGNCCSFKQPPIHVKACYGNYYVYKLVPAINCHLAYCADVNTKVCSTCRDDDTCRSEDKITWRCERKAPTPTPTPPRITVTTTNPPIMAPEVVCGQSMIQVGLN
ncbi:uromodulin-like [Salvelinus namaycush]|uniref:Uromodulin-like n=1 Tax=Salvelinus namaycush TaxID=8040 RepID=A0A8U0TQ61_SALNM|nr:uromodulin-like [Salvelinus namaycush]